MNKFREYVTSSAFRIDLSHRQIQAMLALDISPTTMYQSEAHISTYRALERRGIFYHQMGVKEDRSDRGYFFTGEGRALVDLLKIAGFEFIQEETEQAA